MRGTPHGSTILANENHFFKICQGLSTHISRGIQAKYDKYNYMEIGKRKEFANVPLTVCFNILWCRISFFYDDDECGDNDDDDGNKCGDNGDDAVFLLFQVYWGEHHFLSKREPT